MGLKKMITACFGEYIREEDVDKIFTDDYLKPKKEDILGVIIQNDETHLTFEKFNNFLALLGNEGFIIRGIVGTFIFAYKKQIALNGNEYDFLKKNVKQKKIICFKKEVEFRNCGDQGRLIYIPFFLSNNKIFENFKEMKFNEIIDLNF